MKEPFEEHSVYHIYNHANGEANLFREKKNHRFFLQKFYQYIHPVEETWAWCLMPNHFHMMIRVRGTEELEDLTFQKFKIFGKLKTKEEKNFPDFGKYVSRQFASLFSSYTQAYNKVYERKGSLFQPNIKRKKVTGDSYFTQLILYIHNNPVKHSFVKDLYDWPWSSVHEFSKNSKLPESLISNSTKQQVLDWFGDETNFRQIHGKTIKVESVFD